MTRTQLKKSTVAMWTTTALVGAAALLAPGSVHAANVLWVGQEAPEFSVDAWLQTPPGLKPALADLDGEVIVLEFIELDCPQCQASLSHFNEMIETFKGEPVRFIALARAEVPDIRDFLKENPINTWVGSDPDWSMWRDYRVRGVPMGVVINGAGRVAAVAHPEDITAEVITTAMQGRTPRVPLPPIAFESEEAESPIPMVKIEIRPADQATRMVEFKGETYQGRAVPLKTLIGHASGVPAWRMASDEFLLDARYDVIIEPPFPDADLTDRLLAGMVELMFRPRLRETQRPIWMYELHLVEEGAPGLERSEIDFPRMVESEPGVFAAEGVIFKQIAENLRRDLLMPVIDETGLEGRWDIRLEWDSTDPDALQRAMREQLGVEMRLVRRPMTRVYQVETAEPGDDLLAR